MERQQEESTSTTTTTTLNPPMTMEEFSRPHLDWLRIMFFLSTERFETINWLKLFGVSEPSYAEWETKTHYARGELHTTRILTIASLGVQVRHWTKGQKAQIDFQGAFWMLNQNPYDYVMQVWRGLSELSVGIRWVTRTDIRVDSVAETGHELIEMPDGDPRVIYPFLRNKRNQLTRMLQETGEFKIRLSNFSLSLYRKDLETSEALRPKDGNVSEKARAYAALFESMGFCKLILNEKGQTIMLQDKGIMRMELSLFGTEANAEVTKMLEDGEIIPHLLLSHWALSRHMVHRCPDDKEPEKFTSRDSKLNHWPASEKFKKLFCVDADSKKYELKLNHTVRMAMPHWDEKKYAIRLIASFLAAKIPRQDWGSRLDINFDDAIDFYAHSMMEVDLTKAAFSKPKVELSEAGGPEAVQPAAASAAPAAQWLEARVVVIPLPANQQVDIPQVDLEFSEALKSLQANPRLPEVREAYIVACKAKIEADLERINRSVGNCKTPPESGVERAYRRYGTPNI